jgi:hypothetical protein
MKLGEPLLPPPPTPKDDGVFVSHEELVKYSKLISGEMTSPAYIGEFMDYRENSASLESLIEDIMLNMGKVLLYDRCSTKQKGVLIAFILHRANSIVGGRVADIHPSLSETNTLIMKLDFMDDLETPKALDGDKLACARDKLYNNTHGFFHGHHILFDTPINPKENFMKITRPIMVGSVNILEASDDTLVSLIRKAKSQIEADKDMASISSKFKDKKKELDKVVRLCLKQLDGEEESPFPDV